MKRIIFLFLVLHVLVFPTSAQKTWWTLADDGGITWQIKPGDTAHTDHIEMSGKQLSTVIIYGNDSTGKLLLKRNIIYPMLRSIPNKTRNHTAKEYDAKVLPPVKVGGVELVETPVMVHHKGVMTIQSKTNTALMAERILFPSTDKALLVEWCKLKNPTSQPVEVEIEKGGNEIKTDSSKGIYGQYILSVDVDKEGKFTIQPGETLDYCVSYTGRLACEHLTYVSPAYELAKRREFIDGVMKNLVLKTPDEVINRAFAFAKIRGTESIYETKGGLMHGPGGATYYAAIWANDQAEYINPFFPFLGNITGNESAINSYRHFARFMNPKYEAIPSSIISEGEGVWKGAKDRGDQAMIAYGAARFALAYGDVATAKSLWPLIEWCLQYLETKRTPQGIYTSDSDELEGRFPAGKANLSTNVLAYGGLVGASCLAKELGQNDKAELYAKRAETLKVDIEKYFGANVQGFNTYRYFDKNDVNDVPKFSKYVGKDDLLRAWICLPLTMGMYDRREETLKALFSKHLWTENGILTESGSTTFWDRATLYAFRGLFAAGATDTSLKYFKFYSTKRLLGDHVPYPVEAWPEGNQRHLSAESGLYCRVVTEGLFAIEPIGFRKFQMKPTLPKGWDYMTISNIRAFQGNFSIDVRKAGKGTKITVAEASGKKVFETVWDGKLPVTVTLP